MPRSWKEIATHLASSLISEARDFSGRFDIAMGLGVCNFAEMHFVLG